VEEVVSNALFIGATLMRAETRLGYVRQEDEIAIMKQVGHRLSTVIDEQQLTHNDHQQFLWEMPSISTSKLAEHLDGLRQLFAEPLLINGRKIDIDIYFGVDRNVNKNIKSRMESALAASIDASVSQSSFTIATTADFYNVLQPQFASEFATAMHNGDLELVLEAQQNLGDGQVRSAAAALRWTHPAYGQINTAKLFAMARHSGTLKTVSTYLCTQAIMAAGQLVQQQSDFAINVKISTDILLEDGFAADMLHHILDAKCQPSNLTFEVIDLHDHKWNDAVRVVLHKLQLNGFRIGIGNFGTTDADIDLINIFQPDEIFLAKSFCAELLGSTSSAIFAAGALRIAKANHIITTANGIDDRDVLTALRRHACHKGKGKIIATPLNLLNFCSIYFTAFHNKVG
jgi:EAL domain-containing protein (putative c-di-GMP-specific phosphodiesterase class I)